VPVAVNCCVDPIVMDGLEGVTAMDTKAAGVTFRVVEPLIEPLAAVTVALPEDTLVASPPAAIVATAGFPVLHVAVEVRS